MLRFKEFISEAYQKQNDTQAGSNPGGIHTDESGKKYYIKYYKNGDQAKSEALAGKIYSHMGISTVNPRYENIDGKHAIITDYNDKIRQSKPSDYRNLKPHQADQISRIYHGATLTKNWDVVGLNYDNIMRDHEGNFHAIDHGGTFNFRAQGGHKEFGPDIGEHTSLRDNYETSGRVARQINNDHGIDTEIRALDSVKKMDDSHIHSLFKNSGISNWQELHKNFMSRKKKLIDAYK